MARARETESAAGASWCSGDTRQTRGACDGRRRMAWREEEEGMAWHGMAWQ